MAEGVDINAVRNGRMSKAIKSVRIKMYMVGPGSAGANQSLDSNRNSTAWLGDQVRCCSNARTIYARLLIVR